MKNEINLQEKASSASSAHLDFTELNINVQNQREPEVCVISFVKAKGTTSI